MNDTSALVDWLTKPTGGKGKSNEVDFLQPFKEHDMFSESAPQNQPTGEEVANPRFHITPEQLQQSIEYLEQNEPDRYKESANPNPPLGGAICDLEDNLLTEFNSIRGTANSLTQKLGLKGYHLSTGKIRSAMLSEGHFDGFRIHFTDDEGYRNIRDVFSERQKATRLKRMVKAARANARKRLNSASPDELPCLLVYGSNDNGTGPGTSDPLLAFNNLTLGIQSDGRKIGPKTTFAKGGISLAHLDRLGLPGVKNSAGFIGTGEGRLWKGVLWLRRCSREEYAAAKTNERQRKKIWKANGWGK